VPESVDPAPYLLVGGGRLARHLAHYLDLLGVAHEGWTRSEGVEALGRRAGRARAVLLLIPDDAIQPFVLEHGDLLGDAPRVHCSGAVSVPGVVACHPLGSFGETLFPESVYRSIHLCVEEGPVGFEELFPELPNPHGPLPVGAKVRYHAAAVLAGNFTAMLWQEAARVFTELGVPESGWRAYLETVAINVRTDPDAAVTGPVVRGDAGTIAAHLASLGDDPWAGVYRAFLATVGAEDPTEPSEDPGQRRRGHRDPADALRVGHPIVATTCYDASTAAILDRTELDFLLVGDSVAMVVYGHDSTRPADVEMLARHTAAVRRGAPSRLLVTDLPWVAARDPELAVRAARKLRDAGADGVKLEALPESWAVLHALVAAGIPVMGHVGLLPQLVEDGDFRVAGRGEAAAAVLEAARMQERAGAFALVVECVPSELARTLTEAVSIPTIGIGAGADTDGQILVINDLAGLTQGRTPRFVRAFGDAATPLEEGVHRYVEAVREGSFPADAESYG